MYAKRLFFPGKKKKQQHKTTQNNTCYLPCMVHSGWRPTVFYDTFGFAVSWPDMIFFPRNRFTDRRYKKKPAAPHTSSRNVTFSRARVGTSFEISFTTRMSELGSIVKKHLNANRVSTSCCGPDVFSAFRVRIKKPLWFCGMIYVRTIRTTATITKNPIIVTQFTVFPRINPPARRFRRSPAVVAAAVRSKRLTCKTFARHNNIGHRRLSGEMIYDTRLTRYYVFHYTARPRGNAIAIKPYTRLLLLFILIFFFNLSFLASHVLNLRSVLFYFAWNALFCYLR